MTSPLIITQDGAVTIVTVNRPEVRNALNLDTLAALETEADRIASDDTVQVVILTGAGDKAFVAGADIRELSALGALEALSYAQRGQRVFFKLEALPQIVIGAINGAALGGGCELAMACDLRVASERAVFGQPEVNLGLIPGFGGTQRLPRLIGSTKALELLVTGATLTAEEALHLGLVNKVVPGDQVLEAALALAKAILAKGPLAVRLVKEAVRVGLNAPLSQGSAWEAQCFALACASQDKVEGTTAFLEKRAPVFTGR